MKINFLKFGFFAIVVSMTLFITACGSSAETADTEETTEEVESDDEHGHEGHEHEGHADDGGEEGSTEIDQSGKEYTSAYVCPMHCEGSGSEEAGKCPVCGMDYVELASLEEKDGHDH